jgi:ribosomal protein S18 acetylase RimI-like enzyme
VRPAVLVDEDAVVPLLYASGASIYPRFAGSREAALDILAAAFGRPGTTASAEVVRVAEIDGRVAGALAGFPVSEGSARARRFLRVALGRVSPRRWPRVWRIFRGLRPSPPAGAFYVDSLATDPPLRRRGVGRALLQSAATAAGARGCTHLALETELDNAPARALYRSVGFEETEVLRPGVPELAEAYVCLVRPLAAGRR